MPIAINGSGTITGVSVGGLPDGIVDTDMIAANAVTSAKANPALGKIVQQVFYPYTEVHAISNSNYTQIPNWNAAITPSSASNKILVTTFLNWAGANNSYTIAARLYRKIGSGSYSHLSAASGLDGGGAGSSTNGVHLAAGEQSYDNYVRSFSTGIFEDTTHGQAGTAVSYSLYVEDGRDSNAVYINRYSYTANTDYANYTLSGMLLQEISA
tara:strand:- start:213 stop:848 length:636 start_codon:yes stop_codon:yes gene_type:complete